MLFLHFCFYPSFLFFLCVIVETHRDDHKLGHNGCVSFLLSLCQVTAPKSKTYPGFVVSDKRTVHPGCPRRVYKRNPHGKGQVFGFS